MITLLRLQLRVGRSSLYLLGVVLLLAIWASGGSGEDLPQSRSLFLLFVLLWIPERVIRAAYEDLDAIRWTTPVRRSLIPLAHFVFWSLCAAPAAVGVSLARGVSAHDTLVSCSKFVLLFAALAASTGVDAQRRLSGKKGWRTELAPAHILHVLFPWLLASVWLDSTPESLSWSGAALCAALLAVAWSIRHAERLATGESARAAGPSTAASRPAKCRSPVRSILVATWSAGPSWLLMAAMGGIGIQFFPWPNGRGGFCLLMPLLAVLILARQALARSLWLAPTPIDRRRAFRLLFLPIVAFSLLCAGARQFAQELESDRTVFFVALGAKPPRKGRVRALLLGDVLQVDKQRRTYLGPDPAFMSARLSEQLRAQLWVDVPAERIEAIVRRGWPRDLSAADWSDSQQAVFDATDRVHAELAPEIRTADRWCRFVDFIATGLLLLLGLRLALAGRYVGTAARMCVTVPLAAAAALPNSPALSWAFSAQSAVYAWMQSGGASLAAAIVIGAGVAGTALWHSSLRAFRRIEFTDPPPRT